MIVIVMAVTIAMLVSACIQLTFLAVYNTQACNGAIR